MCQLTTHQPDNKFLTVASRLDEGFNIPDPTKPDEEITSDTLITFSLCNPAKPKFVEKAASGGNNPRHFSFNKGGDLVAVALSNDKRAVVLKRDVKTGKIGGVVAAFDIAGDEGAGVTCVVFDE